MGFLATNKQRIPVGLQVVVVGFCSVVVAVVVTALANSHLRVEWSYLVAIEGKQMATGIHTRRPEWLAGLAVGRSPVHVGDAALQQQPRTLLLLRSGERRAPDCS